MIITTRVVLLAVYHCNINILKMLKMGF